ncbi:MAG: NAD(P)/FAD-dependent oxidoreductase, partial [Rhodospirillales bacterium]|nr:NAD(P)/FAD-dependent oxidoreductase [Rhodospirillales bacterium]
MDARPDAPGGAERFDLVIVGAGFAGLYMLLRARRLGLTAVVLERAGDVGGTWWWNRYPGARCDVESMQYSYSFDAALQQDWHWTERFAAQPEILAYARHVAERFDLRRDIRFGVSVTAARFDAAEGGWRIATADGAAFAARFCVMATGCLSTAKLPEIEGIGTFRGSTYHTGDWPHRAVDFTGLRVGVIGTGSSAIQAIPVIAAQAAHVTVFQRTANFSIPSRNQPMDSEYEAWWKRDYAAHRETARRMRTGILYHINETAALDVPPEARAEVYRARWANGGTAFMGAFADLITSQAANDTAADFVRDRIREIVRDPATAEALAPKDHPIGTKRICVDTAYFAAYNRDNVTLVDLRK